jgi:ubiquinone/menaquinone biosynthesis C-methylase UbiE
MKILDIGVGTGRTTPYLSQVAGEYVGIDYSEAMIARCREKFPGLRLIHADALDLSLFADGYFDAIVFSLNGIDSIYGENNRTRCLRECARTLKPGGVFILSSHNPRYVFFYPVLRGVPWLKKVRRLLYAVAHTLVMLATRFATKAFWLGAGHISDHLLHGGLNRRGLVHYAVTPEHFRAQLEQANFTVGSVLGGLHPHHTPRLFTPWYYYACVRNGCS